MNGWQVIPEPRKTRRGQVILGDKLIMSTQVTTEMYFAFDELARKAERSISAEVRIALREYLERSGSE